MPSFDNRAAAGGLYEVSGIHSSCGCEFELDAARGGTQTALFFLIAVLLMLGVIADSLWGFSRLKPTQAKVATMHWVKRRLFESNSWRRFDFPGEVARQKDHNGGTHDASSRSLSH